ncbi:MAG: DUF1127 domain-containing protein [Pseudomonadota bacterium]
MEAQPKHAPLGAHSPNRLDRAPSPWRAVLSRLGWFVARLQAFREHERLARMPDRMLRDMGLTRDDVLAAQDDLWSARHREHRDD